MLTELAIAGTALVASYPAILLATHVWAKLESFYKPVNENTAVIVARRGQLIRVLFVSLEKHLKGVGRGYERFEIIPEPEPPSLKRSLRTLFLFGGIRWLGIPFLDKPIPYLHVATTFKEDASTGRYRLETRTDIVWHIPMHDELEPFVVRVSFSDGTQVYVVAFTRISKVNPARMVYGTTHWWEAARQKVASVVSSVLSPQNFQTLIKGKGEAEEKISSILSHPSSDTEDYGVRIGKVHLLLVDPATEKDADALRIAFVGEQRARVISSISQSIKEAGAAGLSAATLETMREAHGNITLVGRELGGVVLPTSS